MRSSPENAVHQAEREESCVRYLVPLIVPIPSQYVSVSPKKAVTNDKHGVLWFQDGAANNGTFLNCVIIAPG